MPVRLYAKMRNVVSILKWLLGPSMAPRPNAEVLHSFRDYKARLNAQLRTTRSQLNERFVCTVKDENLSELLFGVSVKFHRPPVLSSILGGNR